MVRFEIAGIYIFFSPLYTRQTVPVLNSEPVNQIHYRSILNCTQLIPARYHENTVTFDVRIFPRESDDTCSLSLQTTLLSDQAQTPSPRKDITK